MAVTLFFSSICALALALLAPAAAALFGHPQLGAVVWLLAAGLALHGLANIGALTLRRDMRFAKASKFLPGKRPSTFLITPLCTRMRGRPPVWPSCAAASPT